MDLGEGDELTDVLKSKIIGSAQYNYSSHLPPYACRGGKGEV